MTGHEKVCVAYEGVGFVVAVAAILSLFLVGCGKEPEPETLVARAESCVVTLNEDGTVNCVCEEVAK